ncbi:hypothetical protein C8Q80DRAFT_1314673 [Daedaleopsis nitida]|nr:hypothetical protein C8Q80DRAFT_1314673 [Daedaleopsis nitida]
MRSPNAITIDATEHNIKSATVFQSSMAAEITRSFPLKLQNGRNNIVISGLSEKIDKESPRIHGLGSAARVFDVCCHTRTMNSKTKHKDEIEELIKKKKELGVERSLFQQESRVFDSDNTSVLLTKAYPEVEFENLLDRVAQRKRATSIAIIELDDKISKLEKEINLLGRKHQGEANAVVAATVFADRDCEVTLQLTYQGSYVRSGLRCQLGPYYDLRASTKDGKPSADISLHYCANISQNTGEDWNEAVLTLSTATSQTLQSLSVPALESLKISATSPTPPARGNLPRHAEYRRGYAEPIVIMTQVPDISRPSSPEGIPSRQPTPPPLAAAVDSRNPLALAFRIVDTVFLPSDGLAHKVSIALLDFSAELKYVCVPRQKEAVFIEASIKNTSDYELLAGPVSVFMDNGFVTKTSLGLISLNESFTCTLGVDTAFKVAYRQDSRTEQEPARNFAEPTKTTTRTVTTTVTNNHQLDISPLVVREALPLGDDEAKVKVTLCKPEGLARAKDEEEIILLDASADVQNLKVR